MERTITQTEFPPAPLPSLTRVAAYARVSSAKEEMLHSLAAQVSYYSRIIQQNPGWLYSGVYADEAITGTKNNRPEFQRMLSDCRDNKIDQIITKSISRFARNTVTLLETVRELKALGVDVYFEEQNIHSMSGDGELMLTILASYAQEESLSVSENCKWQIRDRFKQGELVNLRFMFGYRITKEMIEIDPDQAEIVRMIFADYIKGMGGIRIAAKLNAMGVPTLSQVSWTKEQIMAIIKNEKYTGNALLQKRFVVDHLSKRQIINVGQLPKYFADQTHPAIIDQETFDKAQAVLHGRRVVINPKVGSQNRYPFSGMIKCGMCGKNYKRKVTRGRVLWSCSTYLELGRNACPSKQIPEDILLKLSADVLELSAFDENSFKDQISQILIPEPNQITFTFKDGHSVETIWQDRSRRDSWTDEMKRAASIRTAKQRRSNK
ncbi:MAG: recombinase family protein [Eubacteriales bacterium]|nr:recombinase family protein [Eubacteriales bacterium]